VNYSTLTSASASEKSFFVTCHPGAESVLEQEILGIEGASDVHPGKSGVHFKGNESTVYDVNLWVRSGIRVLELLSQITLDPDEEAGDTLYEAFRGVVEWPEWLHSENMSFSVDSRIWGNSNVTNSQRLNVRAKEAICESSREKNGFKPSPPLRGRVSDMPIFATAFSDVLSIYLDYSGRSLHKRGFASKKMHKASLNECAAAACLQLAGFPELLKNSGGETVTLADPMCGGGTIPIEAAIFDQRVPQEYSCINHWIIQSNKESIREYIAGQDIEEDKR
jgi:23S rRNA G2445 N2-methylase RlmL